MENSKIEELSSQAWAAVVQSKAEEVAKNEGGTLQVIAWEDLTEEERRLVSMPVTWMLSSVIEAVDSVYRERARQEFMAASTEPSGQE